MGLSCCLSHEISDMKRGTANCRWGYDLSQRAGSMADYYDIDHILMEEEPVSIVFRVGANGVGLLDPGSEDNNVASLSSIPLVEAGAKVELPFWLAQDLCYRQAVSINTPTFFNQSHEISDMKSGRVNANLILNPVRKLLKPRVTAIDKAKPMRLHAIYSVNNSIWRSSLDT
eukprot:Gb_23014 [translate_table: standard]